MSDRWHGDVMGRWVRPAGMGLSLLLGFWLLVPVVAFDDPLSTVVLDRDGELLGASIAADGQWRFGVAPEVPEKFAQAILCFEDRRFYLHPGVDPIALARAALRNLQGGRVVSGGSTLTMQVVRLARKGQPAHARGEGDRGRARAAAHALALEAAGARALRRLRARSAATRSGSTPRPGATSAASASRLSWAETATLAVLPNAPALVHPGRNRDRLLAKRDRLLDAAARAGRDRRGDAEPREAGAAAAFARALADAGAAPRRARERGAARAALPGRRPEPVGRDHPPEERPAAGAWRSWRATAATLAENDVRNAAALVLDAPTRRGARLRREPVAARRRRARRARRRDPRAPQHRQRAEAAALRLDARGRRGAAAAARARRADPPRQLPSRELRPGLRRRGAGGPGARALAQRARRAAAARARRRALRRRAPAAGTHDARPPRLRVRPRADPRRRRGLALGRDRGLRRPRAGRARKRTSSPFFAPSFRPALARTRGQGGPRPRRSGRRPAT